MTLDDRPVDAFYAAPAIGSGARPGAILRYRSTIVPTLGRPHQAWQVVYTTHTGRHAPIPASGIVIAPPRPGADSAVAVYCPPFRGLGGRCAPSQLFTDPQPDPDLPAVAAALERGWIVAVPDGPGLGLSGLGPHTFLAGTDVAHSVLDLARAARMIPALDAAGAPCVIWGYADGGRAAVWAAESQPRYAPSLDLRGVAAGAVVTDPGSLAARLDGGPWSGLVLAGLIGLSRAYSYLSVDRVFTGAGTAAMANASGSDAGEILKSYRDQRVTAWCMRPDPWNDAQWQFVLTAESTGAQVPRVPVHLYHGSSDGLIPVGMGQQLYAEYRLIGAEATWRAYATGHIGAAAAGTADALDQLAEDLNHLPGQLRRPSV
ncbi:lipase family protein [Nocardia sp. NPDC050799]|uniref:lipase family protein n=1 Tax=Nocardia sp. NPDC050799 TaxID=3154842 RepID=UPI0033EC4DED